jgi:hypothetical protein
MSFAHVDGDALHFRWDRTVFFGNLEDLQAGVFSRAAVQLEHLL